MNFIRFTFRTKIYLRQFHKYTIQNQIQASVANTTIEALSVPVSEGNFKSVNSKIDKIAHEITSLNLIEVAELTNLLKNKLKLPDTPIIPVETNVHKEEEAPKPIKSFFTLKLIRYNDKQKVALIKEIKNTIPGLNLVQAKKFIESVPQVIKSDLTKTEAESLKDTLLKVGAEVTIE